MMENEDITKDVTASDQAVSKIIANVTKPKLDVQRIADV